MSSLKDSIEKAELALRLGNIVEAADRLGCLPDCGGIPDPEEKGRALSVRGALRYHQGRIPEAVADLREAEALLQAVCGERCVPRATAAMYLGRALVAQGDLEPGRSLGLLAMQIFEETLPEEDPLIAESCFLLSQAAYQLGDLDSAEFLTRRAMAIWEKLQGRECLGVSTCLNNLGRICEERGMLQAGIDLHRQALAIRRTLLGDHEETAFSLGNLGTALASDGQWPEAARTLQECLDCYARAGVTEGFKIEGYRRNLDVCRRALAASEGRG